VEYGPGDSYQETFESLYIEYRLQVLAYCTRRIDRSLASDACSETFLVAWRKVEDLPVPPQTLPFLYGVAAKVIANQRRTVRRKTRLDHKMRNLGVATAEDPSVVVIRAERDRQVEAAVRSLNSRDREIVMLYAWEELPRSAIAEMMGMTKSAVDQRIHRSYKRLGRTLGSLAQTQIHTSTFAEGRGT